MKPWSPQEIEARIPELVERIEEALLGLKTLAEVAAKAKWTYEHAKARATLVVTGRNHDERQAKVLLNEDTDGVTVGRLGYNADLADSGYRNQRILIATLTSELDLARTLHVSARQVP